MDVGGGGGCPGYGDERVLADLCFHWGEAYDFGHDAAAGWWQAARRDTGRVLVAGCPRELRNLVVADYSRRAVPRAARRCPAGRMLAGA